VTTRPPATLRGAVDLPLTAVRHLLAVIDQLAGVAA